jgi:hypothetical protein
MLAVILRLEGRRDETTDDIFRRFKSTEGVVAAYQLVGVDNPEDLVTFTVWKDDASRLKYMNESPIKREVDLTWKKQTRTVYTVRDSKA